MIKAVTPPATLAMSTKDLLATSYVEKVEYLKDSLSQTRILVMISESANIKEMRSKININRERL